MCDKELSFIGGIWETYTFYIKKDVEITQYSCDKFKKCPHTQVIKIEAAYNFEDKYIGDKVSYNIPYVIEAYNEGGFCSTGVCLECVIDAAKTLGLIK